MVRSIRLLFFFCLEKSGASRLKPPPAVLSGRKENHYRKGGGPGGKGDKARSVTGTPLECERRGRADANREDAGRALRAVARTVNTGQRKDMSKSPVADEETMGKSDRY